LLRACRPSTQIEEDVDELSLKLRDSHTRRFCEDGDLNANFAIKLSLEQSDNQDCGLPAFTFRLKCYVIFEESRWRRRRDE